MEDVGIEDSAIYYKPITNITYQPESNKVLCCTPGWRYAAAVIENKPFYGIRASIDTRYGKLCGQGLDTNLTHSVVYVDINYDTIVVSQSPPDTINLWVQTGYIKKRNWGDSSYFIGRYFEVEGEYYYRYIDSLITVPQEGITYAYEIQLFDTYGTWYGIFEGYTWFIWDNDSMWQYQPGNVAQWTAEIYGLETDMAGTINNPCQINNCQIDTMSNNQFRYIGAGLSKNDLYSNDWNKWWIEYVTGELKFEKVYNMIIE